MQKLIRLGVCVALALVVGTGVSSAQSTDLPATKTFTLAPGGTASVSYEAFCLDFGKKFPVSVNAPSRVADAKIQNALYYGLTKNYQTSDARELQYAIWELSEAENVPQSGDVAAEIKAATTAAPALAGTSVLDAVRDNKVKLTLNTWEPIGAKVDLGALTDNFYGKGTLTLENTSQESLTLAMPVGTVFQTPDAESQNMVGYATNVQVNNPATTLPETSAFDSAPSLWIAVVGAYFLVVGMMIKKFMRSYK
ncbi:MAG: hypothetical protein H0T53_06950 [Herpetosiphonaceae bacterium]|nr:hypothetical protein [Herpetosiphonaceae bacterium]